MKKFQLYILILGFFVSITNPVNSAICDKDRSKTECSKDLINYPLFDTPYKVHANYLPVLALRALAHGDIYKEKKKFVLKREYYVRNISGKFQEPYATLVGDGKVTGHGFIGRKISFSGKLNDFPIEYENKMSFSLPKRAKMQVRASIDDIDFLSLVIHSDADAMTNDVEGSFFGRDVKYHTAHRDSDGVLAGHKYKIHTEGKIKEEGNFLAITDGTIDDYKVTGTATLTSHNNYMTTEHYGPIMVKTFITVKD